MKTMFYKCEVCGNVIAVMVHGGGTLVCCGQDMKLLDANTTDAAQEKHVPALQLSGDQLSVQIGSALHPMTPEHFINFIVARQGNTAQAACLTPADAPKASFTVRPGEPVTVYEYCNLHGLWKAEQ